MLKKHCGGGENHPAKARSFSEVYWKTVFFFPSCSIKRKKERKKKNVATSFVTAHAQEEATKTIASLSHLHQRPVPSRARTSAHPAPERQEARQPDRGHREPPGTPIHLDAPRRKDVTPPGKGGAL